MNSKTISIIGPGRVGKALSKVFEELGYSVHPAIGRNDKLSLLGELVFITTPDSQISNAAHSILESGIDVEGKLKTEVKSLVVEILVILSASSMMFLLLRVLIAGLF